MKLAMSGEVLSHNLLLEKALEVTASFDIHNFELWAQNLDALSTTCHDRLYKDRDMDKARQQFRSAGIKVACVAFGGAFHQEIAEDVNLYVRELIRAIETASHFDAGIVNHYCNLISPGFDLDFDVLDRYFTEPLRRAEELGITMVLENEAHDVTHTPENVHVIIDHFNSPNFRSNLDATNFYQAGNEAFPHCYEILKDVIAYVHIKNGCIFADGPRFDALWKGGDMSGHLAGRKIYYTLPNSGAVNITGLLESLMADNYTGFLVLEPHSTLENVLEYYRIAVPFIRKYLPVETN